MKTTADQQDSADPLHSLRKHINESVITCATTAAGGNYIVLKTSTLARAQGLHRELVKLRAIERD